MLNEQENISKEQLLKENSSLKLQNKKLEFEKNSLQSKADSLQSKADSLQSKADSLQSKADYLQFQIDQFKRMLFGAKRERFIPNTNENQMTLPFDVEPQQEPEKEEKTITYVRKKAKRENHPGRMKLPDHLPVEEIILEPEEDTTDMKYIGKEVTDQLELIPAKLS